MIGSIFGVERYNYLAVVALTIGSVPRRIVPKLRQFQWLLIFNNQLKWRNLGTILRGADPTVSAAAPWKTARNKKYLEQRLIQLPTPADIAYRRTN